MRNTINILMLSAVFLYAGCKSGSAPESRGAIIFGDSSMIVTEKDPKYLTNNVQDLSPRKAEPIMSDTVKLPVVQKQDTLKTAEATPKQETSRPVKLKGLEVPFKSLNMFIPDVVARAGRNINWNTAKSASYTLEQGELNNKTITIKGATVTKIMQRYQSVVLLQAPDEELFKLPSFPVSNSEWQTLKGANGVFTISGLGNGQLKYDPAFSKNALKIATQKLARAKRMNKKDEEQLIKSIRNTHTANQAPLNIALQSVVWKITAKDAAGKMTEHELRFDINH